MQYLEETTIQNLIYLLFSSTNKFDLSLTGFEEGKNLLGTIYDNDLGDCFFFTLSNNDEVKMLLDNKEIVQDIKRAKDTDDTWIALFKNVVRLKEQPMNFLDIIKPNNKMFYEVFFMSTFYILHIVNSKKEKVLNYLRKYIENFRLNSLTSEANYYDFERNMNRTSEIFNNLYNKFGSRFNINRTMEIDFKKISLEKELRLYEIILYLQKKNYIKINNCNFIKSNEKSIMNINLTFNIPPTVIYNTENSDMEIIKPLDKSLVTISKDDIVLELTYNSLTRQIFINDNMLKTPHYDSINRVVFEYLYNHPNKRISKKTLEEAYNKEYGENFSKPLHKIAQELGFTKDRKRLFFSATKTSVLLKTQITKKQLEESKIDISKVLPK